MRTLLSIILALSLVGGASGQRVPDRPPASDSLRVFLLTLGPGAATWERFGHNALWIHDPAGTDKAYHYGLFDMSDEGFLLNFLRGRMFYSMGSANALQMIETYRQFGRAVWLQELRLTADEIRELERFLEWNLQPENRVYRYDYFRDNCSTRIRDALDRVLDGAIREALAPMPASLTFRSQAVALTAGDPLLTTGMDLGLGPMADRPISHWELAFIPMRLRDDVQRIGPINGDSVPLVASTRHLPALTGPNPDGTTAAAPPRFRTLWLLLIGVLVGALFAGAAMLASREGAGQAMQAAARVGLGLGGTLWGLVAGILGLVLLGLWTLTDHEVAWRNENLLQANPLALALVVLVPLAMRRGGSGRAKRVAGLLAALSAIGLVLHFLPVTPQANLPIIALALPIHAGLYVALRQFPPPR